MINRHINLPKSHSFFLFGPRQTGKTTLVHSTFPAAQLIEYNLLLSEEFSRLVAHPEIFREEVLALPESISHIFIDEVQRIPELLHEVQYLIDKKIKKKFILSGSSARKLKRGKANLLGGRAWSLHLFPLTYTEVEGNIPLEKILSYGTLPYNVVAESEEEKSRNLRSYVDVYVKEEIEAEALSRNIGGFIRFLGIAGQSNGEQLNYSNVSRDVGISSVTVKEYFKILEDTLLGNFLLPYSASERKRHKTSPKFYFFDTGVLRALQKRLSLEITSKTFEYGNYFETWIINEVMRISSYQEKDFTLSFLRTANNAEVDLIIETPSGRTIAVEIKSKPAPIESDYRSGFDAIKTLCPGAECICVCTAPAARKSQEYLILPYEEFFRFVEKL